VAHMGNVTPRSVARVDAATICSMAGRNQLRYETAVMANPAQPRIALLVKCKSALSIEELKRRYEERMPELRAPPVVSASADHQHGSDT